MTQKPGKTYECKKCGCREFIPEGEFGLKTSQLITVWCPRCLCRNHKYKMKEIIKE